MNNKLAVVILTFNEELNLPKCLESIKNLDAKIFIIDSFSTDATEQIAMKYGAEFIANKFETHTKQWKFALTQLPDDIDWVLGLDADQTITTELSDELIKLFNPNNKISNSGYYIRRRNYFLGKWIRFGGYQNRYLLKLFKKSDVFLDESELMDHHFYVNGTTSKLKSDMIENNLKEDLPFWKNKHIKYAKLQAKEEYERLITNKGSLFGNQDSRRLYFKNIWNTLPLFIRPIIYFLYRYILQGGFLDGIVGTKFHYLQAYWYRRTVDENIFEMYSTSKKSYKEFFFVSRFLIIFVALYYFNIAFIGITGRGGVYIEFIDQHLNYIRWLRESIIYLSSVVLHLFHYDTIRLPYHLKIIDGVRVGVGYSCLGYGIMSFQIALALSYPFKYLVRRVYLFVGLLIIYILNILRISAVGIAYTELSNFNIDHHFIFNIISYFVIFAMMVITIRINEKYENTRT